MIPTTIMNKSAYLIPALAMVFAGCSIGGGDHSPGIGPDGSGADIPPQAPCAVGLEVTPPNPVAGPTTVVHVTASLNNGPGVPSYHWRVGFNGTPILFTQLGSEIDFNAPEPGVYDVAVDLDGSASDEPCSAAQRPVNVAAPNARTEMVRLRVLPPPGMNAPPVFEKLRRISGGATMNIGTIDIDTGERLALRVLGPAGGIPAYLRFSPTDTPDAIVEAFANPAGEAVAGLLLQPYNVLVIPSADGVAPRRITGWSPTISSSQLPLVVDAGSLIMGTVTGPGGPGDTSIADAKVQLVIDGVPSTLATAGSDGRFELRAATGARGPVTVEVTPDPTTGLPRLSATSSSWDLGAGLTIQYPGNLARKNLAGMVVQRILQGQPTPLAQARVTVVGSLVAGMVTAGASASATGTVRIATSTDASGRLPSVLVPSASLSAVIEVSPGDLAVVELDATATVPVIRDAPPMQLIATAVLGASAALPDAVLDLVPTGALAMAGAATVHVTANASGAITAVLAFGGHYDLRFRDPAGRRAPLVIADRVVSTIALSYSLPPALQLRGTLTLDGLQPMANASVQLLCNTCSGVDRDRPIAETVSDNAGQFVLAVPDPGTM